MPIPMTTEQIENHVQAAFNDSGKIGEEGIDRSEIILALWTIAQRLDYLVNAIGPLADCVNSREGVFRVR
jgi:hypothetical protein